MQFNKLFTSGTRTVVFKKKEKTVALILLALTFILVLMLKDTVRPHYHGNEFIKYFLSICPNFLPAIAAPFVFIPFNKESSWPFKHDGFLSNCLIIFVSLVIHEFIRSRKGMLFDWNDVAASLVGCTLAYLIYIKLWKGHFSIQS